MWRKKFLSLFIISYERVPREEGNISRMKIQVGGQKQEIVNYSVQ